jgi:hypothetical protein
MLNIEVKTKRLIIYEKDDNDVFTPEREQQQLAGRP